MADFFRCLVERVKAILAASAALDLEADFVSRTAERKAELIRQAKRYEDEGLPTLALDLRQQAEAISLDKPFRPALTSSLNSDASATEPETPSNESALVPEPEPRGHRSRKSLALGARNGGKS